ncbi:MAG: DUF4404 family protein [Anaerolineae bacterium]
MTDPYVHELLVQLHHELKHAHTISERDRELFDHLATHVQELIDKPETPHGTLTTKLEASVAEMETSHPALATLMGRVVSVLSNMGI